MLSTFEQFSVSPDAPSDPYLQQLGFIAQMTQGKQQRYYQWLLEQTKRVSLVSVRELQAELGITAAWTKKHCKLKACYQNATRVCDLHPDVRYVEGILLVHGMVPTEHAWNSYQGVYFDVTDEFLLGNRRDPHYEQISYTHAQVWRAMEETGHYGDLVRLHYVNEVEK